MLGYRERACGRLCEYDVAATRELSEQSGPDALMAEGNAAATIEASVELYNQAEDLILEDMPAIPPWFGRTFGAYNVNVWDVVVDPFGNLDFTLVGVSD